MERNIKFQSRPQSDPVERLERRVIGSCSAVFEIKQGRCLTLDWHIQSAAVMKLGAHRSRTYF